METEMESTTDAGGGYGSEDALAGMDPEMARKLVAHKEELARSVAEKNARLQKQLAEEK